MRAPPWHGVRVISPAATAPDVGLGWLIRVRWGAVLGQVLLVTLAVTLVDATLPRGSLAALVLVTALSNVGLAVFYRRGALRGRLWVVATLVLDVVVLTALLRISGGAGNPFTVFYLVHVALAALLLDVKGTWFVAALTSAGFGLLFLYPGAHCEMMAAHGASASSFHLQGMWLAYTLAAFFVGYFVSRVAAALQEREKELAELQRYAARAEKLASLSTLAAGAAHELGTPLGTIALVAKELARALDNLPGAAALAEDARLVRTEVARCRGILQRLGAQAGNTSGEMPLALTPSHLEGELRAELGERAAAMLSVETTGETSTLLLPERNLVQVLVNLVRNAVDAQRSSGATQPVALHIAVDPEVVRFSVVDRGTGMADDVLKRIGEPFFTTKAPGAGLGLGVFLAHAFAEKLGGRLEFTSRVGGGTKAMLTLPRIFDVGAAGARAGAT